MLLLLTNAALAAELSEYWRPAGLPDNALLAQSGLVVADFDHDGQLDQVAEYVTDEATPQGGFVATLSSTGETYVLPTGDEILGFQMAALDLYGDGGDYLVVWQSELDDGDLFVFDVSVFTGMPIEKAMLFYVEGPASSGSGFSTSWAAPDFDGDGSPELAVGMPGNPGSTYTFDIDGAALPVELEAQADHRGLWTGLGTGWGVLEFPDLDGKGSPDLVLLACKDDSPDCGAPGVVVVPGEDWTEREQEITGDLATTQAQEPPDRPFVAPDADDNGTDEAAWPTSDAIHIISPTEGELGFLEVPGRVHHLRAGDADLDGRDDIWVLEAAGLSLYNDPVESTPLEQIAPFGGQLLTQLGDLDGDGCTEVAVSVPSEGVVYRVDSACIVDTGTESVPDSQPDSGPDSQPDSDPDTDSDPATDSTPSGDSDSGPPLVCEPEYGWTCGPGSGATGAGVALILLGLGLTRRRRSS